MQYRKEKFAMYLGWISFVVTLVGIFLPWGTYSTLGIYPYEIRWVSGLTSAQNSNVLVACVLIIVGLLGSTVKASKVTVIFLGVGALLLVLTTGLFISIYYYKYSYIHPQIHEISIGSFVTLFGGACELLAALLYTQHIRTQATQQQKQLD